MPSVLNEREAGLKRRGGVPPSIQQYEDPLSPSFSSSSSLYSKQQQQQQQANKQASWRRILLLIIAITIHNIPGLVSLFAVMSLSLSVCLSVLLFLLIIAITIHNIPALVFLFALVSLSLSVCLTVAFSVILSVLLFFSQSVWLSLSLSFTV